MLSVSMVWFTAPCRLESSREEMRARGDLLQRELQDLQRRSDELAGLAQEAQSLKDEMDILRWGEEAWQGRQERERGQGGGGGSKIAINVAHSAEAHKSTFLAHVRPLCSHGNINAENA